MMLLCEYTTPFGGPVVPGVYDPQVCDHMLGRVARHDQAELPGPESKRAQGEGDRRHLVTVVTPGQSSPAAVFLPSQRRPVTPLHDRVAENGADGLSRYSRIDGGALRDHVLHQGSGIHYSLVLGRA